MLPQLHRRSQQPILKECFYHATVLAEAFFRQRPSVINWSVSVKGTSGGQWLKLGALVGKYIIPWARSSVG